MKMKKLFFYFSVFILNGGVHGGDDASVHVHVESSPGQLYPATVLTAADFSYENYGNLQSAPGTPGGSLRLFPGGGPVSRIYGDALDGPAIPAGPVPIPRRPPVPRYGPTALDYTSYPSAYPLNNRVDPLLGHDTLTSAYPLTNAAEYRGAPVPVSRPLTPVVDYSYNVNGDVRGAARYRPVSGASLVNNYYSQVPVGGDNYYDGNDDFLYKPARYYRPTAPLVNTFEINDDLLLRGDRYTVNYRPLASPLAQNYGVNLNGAGWRPVVVPESYDGPVNRGDLRTVGRYGAAPQPLPVAVQPGSVVNYDGLAAAGVVPGYDYNSPADLLRSPAFGAFPYGGAAVDYDSDLLAQSRPNVVYSTSGVATPGAYYGRTTADYDIPFPQTKKLRGQHSGPRHVHGGSVDAIPSWLLRKKQLSKYGIKKYLQPFVQTNSEELERVEQFDPTTVPVYPRSSGLIAPVGGPLRR